jgi:hypothetical protein
MTLIEFHADLKRLTETLVRIAEALERVSPPPRRGKLGSVELSTPTETDQYFADVEDAQAEGKA